MCSSDDSVITNEVTPNPNLSRKRSLEDGIDHVAKRTRYNNYYKLASETSLSSEDTESVTSLQNYETDIAQDTPDTDTKSEGSLSEYEVEYEVATSSENDNDLGLGNDISSGCSDDALAVGAIAAVLCHSSLEKWLTDGEESDESTAGESLRPIYRTCTLCKEVNNNPLYRYCQECFQKRKDLFPPRPRGCKKRKRGVDKMVKAVTVTKTITPPSSQDSGIGDVNTSSKSMNILSKTNCELCMMCNVETKNSIFLHGATGHMVCCYKCSLKTWISSKRCPVCNRCVQNVVKIFKC